ncbi:MAG: hypothetical protein PHH36_00105 [Sideroxydans sp.]|nr:hypothetical protein [Sideroxydans sp.]
MRVLLTLFIAVTYCSASAAPLSDSDFSKTFLCPEDLPTDQAREDALRNFLSWVRQQHPNFTAQEAMQLRFQLLEEHHCGETLATIQSSSPAENSTVDADRIARQTPATSSLAKESEADSLVAKYAKSLKISQKMLTAPLAFQIGGEINFPFVKFIDAAFRFGKSRPTVKANDNRVIIRMSGRDELTGEESRTDYLIVAHEQNGKVIALMERMVITDSNGVQELKPSEIPTFFGLLWGPVIASMN